MKNVKTLTRNFHSLSLSMSEYSFNCVLRCLDTHISRTLPSNHYAILFLFFFSHPQSHTKTGTDPRPHPHPNPQKNLDIPYPPLISLCPSLFFLYIYTKRLRETATSFSLLLHQLFSSFSLYSNQLPLLVFLKFHRSIFVFFLLLNSPQKLEKKIPSLDIYTVSCLHIQRKLKLINVHEWILLVLTIITR